MNVAQAFQEGNVAKAVSLLHSGSDPNARATDSALWIALGLFEKGNPHCTLDVIELLLSKGADPKWAHEEYGCHSHSRETCWQRAVSISRRCNSGELMVLFLRYRGDPNEQICESFGGMRTDGSRTYYPLHMVSGFASCVEALLKAGAQPDCRRTVHVSNERGYDQNSSETLLYTSVVGNHFDVVKVLLEYNANPNLTSQWTEHVPTDDGTPDKDPRGDNFRPSVRCVPDSATPLQRAILRESKDIARLLVLFGADPTIPQQSTKKECFPSLQ